MRTQINRWSSWRPPRRRRRGWGWWRRSGGNISVRRRTGGSWCWRTQSCGDGVVSSAPSVRTPPLPWRTSGELTTVCWPSWMRTIWCSCRPDQSRQIVWTKWWCVSCERGRTPVPVQLRYQDIKCKGTQQKFTKFADIQKLPHNSKKLLIWQKRSLWFVMIFWWFSINIKQNLRYDMSWCVSTLILLVWGSG